MCDKFQEIKKQLLTQVESQMAHLECVDTKEMGEVIDMIKDLEEAIYYCTITEAMNELPETTHYYTEKYKVYCSMHCSKEIFFFVFNGDIIRNYYSIEL